MRQRITSVHNERVKYIRSLGRRRVRQRERRFAVEGTRLADEVVRAGIKPALVLCSEEWSETPVGRRLSPALHTAEAGCFLASNAVMAACADTVTPQGVLAVVPFLDLRPRPGLVLVLDRLQDPGNLGTIFRSAEASGVGQVILAPETVDQYNPKVVRGAMGAHFRLPIASLAWEGIGERLEGRAVWLADAGGDVTYDAADWTVPSALIVGGEADGASDMAHLLAMGTISIPMVGGADSLNAAMAATVILFEVARQRRLSATRPPSPVGSRR